MSKKVDLQDASEREKAVTTFDRNVVVTAGAGTGKTALLTSRLLHIFLQRDHPIAPDQCTALTFTNKAAGEMSSRLREYLERIIQWAVAGGPPRENRSVIAETYRSILGKYGWTEETLEQRAREVLQGIEQTPISTYNGFAARLLRQYPLQAGVDPRFRDNGNEVLDEWFDRDWQAWLAEELSDCSTRKDLWKAVLDRFRLSELRALARELCSELLPLNELEETLYDGSLFEVDGEWLARILKGTKDLISQFPDTKHKFHKQTEAAFRILEGFRDRMDETHLQENLNAIRGRLGPETKDFTKENYEFGKRVIRIADRLASLDRSALKDALNVVLGFSRKFREDFAQKGYLTFDAQLVRARNLLRDHPSVRKDLKQRIRHLLVDEFQDTNPIQYEIVLYLAEELESNAVNWRDTRLESGKLFLVGDSKQSIYRFRGANIEAYTDLLEDVLSEPPLQLSVNFRSHDRLVNVVNGLFESLLQEKEKIQPAYHPSYPRPDGSAKLDAQKVELRVVRPGDNQNWAAEDASREEAREIARWIREDLVGVEKIPDEGGKTRTIEYRDIAILFRTRSKFVPYVNCLRELNIPYATDSGKSFFETQEITDFLNLLNSIALPEDHLALAGVLRSPIGGLTDKELLAWAEAISGREEITPKAEAIIRRLDILRKDAQRLPVPEVFDRIFQTLPVLESAILLAGEQGRFNVLKARSMILRREGFSGEGFSGLVDWLRRQALAREGEEESPLAEENIKAVRLMTIHSAKGLEFPVVVLAGLQAGKGSGPKSEAEVFRNPLSCVWGLRLGSVETPQMVRADDRDAELEDAEERRVFFVAATRARERLVLSVAHRHGKKTLAKAEGILAYLNESLGMDIRLSQEDAISVGDGQILRTIVPATSLVLNVEATKSLIAVPAGFEKTWIDRKEKTREVRNRIVECRPSDLDIEKREFIESFSREGDGDPAALIGQVAHSVLESVVFASPMDWLDENIERSMAECRVELNRKEGQEIRQEVKSMLKRFFTSVDFKKIIQPCEELGREIPCLLSRKSEDGFEQSVEGRADLILKDREGILVVDYKTSRTVKGALEFRTQGILYCRAISEVFGEESVRFGVAFLRRGHIDILRSEDLIQISPEAI